MEQLITGGKADAARSIAGGLINAVSGAIYGNNPLGSLKEAFIKGAKAGAATSGINYLSEVFGGQDEERRSGTLRGSLGLVPFERANDPRHGCMTRDPFGGMMEGGSDYGYRYQMPRSERPVRKAPERFSLAEFGREVVTGFVMGGLSSAAFYGAGRAVEAVKSSVRSGYEGGTSTVVYGTDDIANYQYNMIENPGPLAEMTNQPAKNFYGGRYNVEVLQEDKIMYRAGNANNPYGRWFTSEPPASVASVRIDTAVKPHWIDPKTGAWKASSYIDNVYAIKIPKETTAYTGSVGPQGSAYMGGYNVMQTYIDTLLNFEVIGKTPLQ